MDSRKHAEDAMTLVKKICDQGPRLPGSEEEKKASKALQQEIIEKTGLTPTTEKFLYAPEASIGAINKLGWAGLFCTFLFLLGGLGFTMVAFIGYLAILAFLLVQIIRYTGFFDSLFKHATSENIITELEPQSGKVDYTIYLGAHYDSSWNWKHSARNPNTAIIKTAFGVVCLFVMIVMSLLKILTYFPVFDYSYPISLASTICGVISVIGFFFITQYLTQDKTQASPGAMDNMSGIALNIELMKHFKENPEDLPENCKLVNICFAAEEAGLKGSKAYVKNHKDDEGFKDSYVINVDSIADPDFFEAITGDPWQGTHFDAKLIALTMESMKECGIEKPKTMVNPVGGCDSTPFCQAGVKTVTVAAQNPTITDYYHTFRDVPERIDVSTFETGYNVIYTLIKKIGEEHK